MKIKIAVLSLTVVFSPSLLAGNLDSPAAPSNVGSAMFTLKDIYNRLNDGTTGSKRTGAFVEPTSGPTAGTGHTLDDIMAKTPVINSNGATAAEVLSGKVYWGLLDDNWGIQTGTYEAGPTCSGTLNGSTRWCDNGNGTVTDMTTELVWLKKADWGGQKQWDGNSNDNAHVRAGILNSGTADADLSDGSQEGDWRLPTKTELDGITIGSEPVSSSDMRAFSGVQTYHYWSSSTYVDNTANAWDVYLNDGGVGSTNKSATYYVWPVRGGQ